MRKKLDAGPDNYFITVNDRFINVPLATAKYFHIELGKKYLLTTDGAGKVYFKEENPGNLFAAVSSHCVRFNCRSVIEKLNLKHGRYVYAGKLDDYFILIFDATWV